LLIQIAFAFSKKLGNIIYPYAEACSMGSEDLR